MRNVNDRCSSLASCLGRHKLVDPSTWLNLVGQLLPDIYKEQLVPVSTQSGSQSFCSAAHELLLILCFHISSDDEQAAYSHLSVYPLSLL